MQKIKSEYLFKKAVTLFPGGVNSPVRAFKSVGGTPIFFEKGQGSHVWDADGNEFIDFCSSWGPLISGHAHPDIVDAICKTAKNGTSFGAPSRLENELGDLIISNHNYIEKIRFVSSGTEATMSAIRLARGYTKRTKFIKFDGCYHGHADHLLVKAGSGLATFGTSSSAGVPESFANETIVLPLNDLTAVENAFFEFKNQIACIIIEPIPANNGLLLQTTDFLNGLKKICKKNGTLLIFDEVISGFRVGFEGATGYYRIQPDIITFGKIIGGGLPVGAYASSAEIMSQISPEGNVYQAGTLSGNPVAMAAGIAQLNLCLAENFYQNLAQKTMQFVNELSNSTKSANVNFKIHSIGSIFWFAFSDRETIRSASEINADSMSHFNKLHHYLLENGVYFGPSGYEVGFVSTAHSIEDLKKAAKLIAQGILQL